MKLIIGLGNPGKEYENTRHNIGFKAIDLYAHHLGVELNKRKFKGRFYKGDGFILAKPYTYMNLSGLFVQKMCNYFKIDLADLLIIYDDLSLPTATLRYREKGSAGGQKGMLDIITKLDTTNIKRLKIGIGHPRSDAKNHVLGVFSSIQITKLDAKKDQIIDFIAKFIKES